MFAKTLIIEEKEELEKMKRNRERKQEDCISRSNSLKKKKEEEQKHKDDFKDTVWNVILKENEIDFQDAFSGFRNSKEKFRDEVIKRYKRSHSSTDTRESLIERSKTLFSKKPEIINSVDITQINLSFSKIKEIEQELIWSKVIVGNKDVPISKLIEFLDNADWVNRGRRYIQSDGVCPFCQQKTITNELEEQFNSFLVVNTKKILFILKH